MGLAAKAWMFVPEHRKETAEASAAVLERRGQEGFKHTSLHLDLAGFLLDAGLELASEVQFGRYCVDLYDPTRHLAFEADGLYYHELNERENPGYYARRDAELLERFNLPVVRFTEEEINAFTA